MKPIKDMLLKMREELVRGIARRSKATAVSGVSDIGDILDSVSEERTYGLCEECGVKIPRARLKVVPFAKYCVECKEAIEREEKYAREEPEEGIKKVPMAEAEE
jgi:RNA polymerase-binding transcription factor DksA